MKNFYKKFVVPISLAVVILLGIPVTWIGGHDWVFERSIWNGMYATYLVFVLWLFILNTD